MPDFGYTHPIGACALLVDFWRDSQDAVEQVVKAAEPKLGEWLHERVCTELHESHGLDVKLGVFGGMMDVELVNDGPVTLIVRREPEAAD